MDITADILIGVKKVLEEKPDMVLIHGDTTTSFAAALASYYLQIRVGHVEAGLRTNGIYSPFLEEFKCQTVGNIAYFHFAPTEIAAGHLIKEGKERDRIFVTGNTEIDALKTTIQSGYRHK